MNKKFWLIIGIGTIFSIFWTRLIWVVTTVGGNFPVDLVYFLTYNRVALIISFFPAALASLSIAAISPKKKLFLEALVITIILQIFVLFIFLK